MANTKDFSLVVAIKANTDNFKAGLNKAKSDLNNFTKSFKNIAATLGIAFSTKAIIDFSVESMKLAAAGEGIHNAFKKLGNLSLEPLRKATRGVLDSNDLERLTVKANSFNIPIKDLAIYLQYATQRAMETGESVGDLSDRIVNALGRKGGKALVDLGFTAAELSTAMKSSGGVLDLVKTKLAAMGDVADTSAIKFGRVSTAWGEFKESWGKFLNDSPLINKALKIATDLMTGTKHEGVNNPFAAWEGLTSAQYQNLKKQTDDVLKQLNADVKSHPELQPTIDFRMQSLDFLNDKIKNFVEPVNAIEKSAKEIWQTEYKITKEKEAQVALWKKQIDDIDLAALKLKTSTPSKLGIKGGVPTLAAPVATPGLSLMQTGINIPAQMKLLEDLHSASLISDEEFLKKRKDLDLLSAQDSANQRLIIEAQYNKDMQAIRMENSKTVLQSTGNVLSAMGGMFEAQKNEELKAAGNNAARREQIERKYAEKQKKIAIGQAVIAGALGVITSLEGPPIYKWIEAASVVAATAIEIATISRTSFAKGGVVSGPTQATIGEYAGARSNPEVVAPLDKLKSLLGGAGGGEVTFRIDGTQLVGVLSNHNRKVGGYR